MRCKQRLNIPKTAHTLLITCPRCNTSFRYPALKFSHNLTQWLQKIVQNHPLLLGVILTFWIFLISSRYSNSTLTLRNFIFITLGYFCFWFVAAWLIEILKEEKTKWYYRKWVVLIILFILTPLGVILLWAGSQFRKPAKITLTLLFGGWFLVYILQQGPDKISDYSPKNEIAKLFGADKDKVFIKTASDTARASIQDEIASSDIKSSLFRSYIAQNLGNLNTPAIAALWKDSIAMVRSYDKNDKPLALGSGVLFTETGAVITNHHVIESAYLIQISFIDGRSYKNISLISDYPSRDIAILHIEQENENFAPVILGDSDETRVGEKVIAIGNPAGWENSLSEGIVSGIREVDNLRLIQTTAPVSAGSSGGALLNMAGELIGITTLKSSEAQQNLNFAVPINVVKSLINMSAKDDWMLKKADKFKRLGVEQQKIQVSEVVNKTDINDTLFKQGYECGYVVGSAMCADKFKVATDNLKKLKNDYTKKAINLAETLDYQCSDRTELQKRTRNFGIALGLGFHEGYAEIFKKVKGITEINDEELEKGLVKYGLEENLIKFSNEVLHRK